MIGFDDLPDELIVLIFSFCNCYDRCVFSGVCKRWRRIAKTSILWKEINLFPHILTIRKLNKFITTYATSQLNSLILRGGTRKYLNSSSYSNDTITEAILERLSKKCPNLKSIVLVESYIHNKDFCVQLKDFPSSLEKISFRSCVFSNNSKWFVNRSLTQEILPNLTSLDISNCSFTSYSILQTFDVLPNIDSLNLSRCLRVTNETVKGLVRKQPNFKMLCLNYCRIDDEAVEIISQHGAKLTELHLSGTQLTDNGLCYLNKTRFANLKFFTFMECPITDDGVSTLTKSDLKLQYMHIHNTCITPDGINLLRNYFSNCKILF